jgi:hypothetical protein
MHGCICQDIQRLAAMRCFEHLMTLLFEGCDEELSDRLFVVDDQNRRHQNCGSG